MLIICVEAIVYLLLYNLWLSLLVHKPTSLKNCCTSKVSIISLPINYKKDAGWAQCDRSQKKILKTLHMMKKRDLLFVHLDIHSVRKMPPPQKPSATICKIDQHFITPSPPLYVRHKWISPKLTCRSILSGNVTLKTFHKLSASDWILI